MLIYLDKKSAQLLRLVLNYHLQHTIDDKRKVIYRNLISQTEEGLKNYL